MGRMNLQSVLDFVCSPHFLWAILWTGAAVLTVTLLILMRTRWGQAKPLSKCIVLSIFTHALLLGYAYMTNLFFDGPAAVWELMNTNRESSGAESAADSTSS